MPDSAAVVAGCSSARYRWPQIRNVIGGVGRSWTWTLPATGKPCRARPAEARRRRRARRPERDGEVELLPGVEAALRGLALAVEQPARPALQPADVVIVEAVGLLERAAERAVVPRMVSASQPTGSAIAAHRCSIFAVGRSRYSASAGK